MVATKRLSKSSSQYQAFHLALVVLSSQGILKGLFLQPSGSASPSTNESKQIFRDHYETVMVDPSGTLNLAHSIPKDTLLELHYQASESLSLLEKSDGNFDKIFMTPTNVTEKYDVIFWVHNIAPLQEKGHEGDNANPELSTKNALLQKLSLALAVRCKSVSFLEGLSRQGGWNWPCNGENASETVSLAFGAQLNLDSCNKLIDMGPPANDEEKVKEFKALWGPKAEMRRFKDGSIVQAAVWEEDVDQASRHHILKLVIQHILKLHFGIAPSSTTITSSQLDSFIPRDISTTVIHSAFIELQKNLNSISLPLSIREILPIFKAYGFAEVFPPLPNSEKFCDWTPTLRTIIRFHASSKWPRELNAFTSVKTAMLIKIAELLKQDFNYDCRIQKNCVLVHIKGFWFSVEINHDAEMSLLKKKQKEINKDGNPQGISLDQTASKMKVDYHIIPQHVSTLHSIYVQNSSFSMALRFLYIFYLKVLFI